ESYRMDFRDYPPDTFGAYNGSECLVYFLSTAFRITPNTSNGEVGASINGGPYAKFNDVELRPTSGGRQALVDAWNTPLKYKLVAYQEEDLWDASKKANRYRVVLYSCGPNQADDNGAGDDIQVNK